MSMMMVMNPMKITDSMISNYTASYPEPESWVSTKPYTAGNRATVGKDVYECITANTNTYPPNNTTNYQWIYAGVSNKFKAFDDKVNTKTESIGSISFTLTPNDIIQGIALFNVQCVMITIVMTDPAEEEVYRREISTISDINVDNMFDWLFEDIYQKSDVTVFDLPPYRNASLHLTLSGADTETVSLGMVLVGKVRSIGWLNWGFSADIIDYSTKETDAFGNVTVVPRNSSKRTNYDIDIETARADFIYKELSKYTTKPVVWVGSEDYEITIVYGFFKNMPTTLSNSQRSKVSVEVEGVI